MSDPKMAPFPGWIRKEKSCEHSGSKCKLVRETQFGVRQANIHRYKFYCKNCGHMGVSAFQYCLVCDDWINVNKIPHHMRSRGHNEKLRLRGMAPEGHPQVSEAPTPPTTPPPVHRMPMGGKNIQLVPPLSLDDETDTVDHMLAGDYNQQQASPNDVTAEIYSTNQMDIDAVDDIDKLAFETIMESCIDDVDDGSWPPNEELPNIALDLDTPGLALLGPSPQQDVSALLDPDRVWWKDYGVRIRLRLRHVSPELQRAFRPQYDYLKIHILSPEEQQRITGYPAICYQTIAVHDDYHVNLKKVDLEADGDDPTNDVVELSFNSFNPRDDIFGHVPDELPVDEVHGVATLKFKEPGDNVVPQEEVIETGIVFYRRLEKSDYENKLGLINRLLRDVSFSQNTTGNDYYSGGGSSTSAADRSMERDSQRGSNKRPRQNTYADNTPDSVAFRAADRALVVIVRNFRRLDPPASMLEDLEPVANQCGLSYLLHDLVFARLSSTVRSVIAEVMKRSTVDPRLISDSVLEYLGCDFAVEEAWAAQKILSFICKVISSKKRELRALKARNKLDLDRLSLTAGIGAWIRRGNNRMFSTRSLDFDDVTTAESESSRPSFNRRHTVANVLATVVAAAASNEEEPSVVEEAQRGVRFVDGDGEEEVEDQERRPTSRKQRRQTAPFFQISATDPEIAALAADAGSFDSSQHRVAFVRSYTGLETTDRVAQVASEENEKYGPEEERMAREWIERVLKKEFTRSFPEELRSGSILCDLMNKIQHDAIKDHADDDDQRDANVAKFLAALAAIGVTETFLPSDLSDGTFRNVVKCVLALSEKAKHLRSDIPKPRPAYQPTSRLVASVVGDSQNEDSNEDSDDEDDHKGKKSFMSRLFGNVFTTAPPRRNSDSPAPTTPTKDVPLSKKPSSPNTQQQKLKLDGSNALVVDEPLGSNHLIVWSTKADYNQTIAPAEHALCSLLHTKKKHFEVVYLDITPERRNELIGICGGKEVPLPALTIGPEYAGDCAAVQQLQDDGTLDSRIAFATRGVGFWVLPNPDEWKVHQLGGRIAHTDASDIFPPRHSI